MSMGSVDMVEEIVPYLGLDQLNVVPFSCGGALCMPRCLHRGAPPPFDSFFDGVGPLAGRTDDLHRLSSCLAILKCSMALLEKFRKMP